MQTRSTPIGLANLLFCGFALAAEPEVVNWMLLDLPPNVILENGQPTRGTTDQRLKMVIAQWPEATHTFSTVNASRAFTELGRPDGRSCYPLTILLPERERRYYMTPFYVGYPYHLIVRKDAAKKLPMNTKGEVLPVALFEQTKLRGLVNPVRSYTPLLDALLARHGESGPITRVNPANGNANLSQMVALNRADYTLEYDQMFKYQVDQIPSMKGTDLVSIPIAGVEPSVIAIACPRNEWGRLVIQKIDAIITSLANNPNFQNPSNPWISPQLRKTYKPVFDEFYRQRAKPSERLLAQLAIADR